jgi:hypothetical protein
LALVLSFIIRLADTALVAGQLVSATSLAAGSYMYYSYPNSAYGNVTFTVTPTTGGDPDLYISLSAPFDVTKGGRACKTGLSLALCGSASLESTKTGAAADTLVVPANSGASFLAVLAFGSTASSFTISYEWHIGHKHLSFFY